MSFKAGKWAVPSSEHENAISSPIKVEKTVGITIPELFRQNLHKWKNAPAFECGITGKCYTHGEIFQKSLHFAAALKQLGLKRGDVCFILLQNIPEYPIILIGIWEAGLIASPSNPTFTADEVARQVNDCKGKVIITVPKLLPTVEKVKANCPSVVDTITIGEAEGCHYFFEMLNTDLSNFRPVTGSEINTLDETVLLPYSSGTTLSGPPKGVEITHSTFTTNLLQVSYKGYERMRMFEEGTVQERFIAVLPFFHVYGLHAIIAVGLFKGAHIVCLPRFHPQTYIKVLKRLKPTTLHLVTPLITFVNDCPDISKEDLSETETIFAGGAPAGPSILEQILKKVDKESVFYQEVFGMTELSPVICLLPPETRNTKLGSSGALIPGTSCKILDLETGENLGPNKIGEICIKGPQLMKGYYNNEKATREIIDSDGFLHTGDVGYFDDDGLIYIKDRVKELIKVKAFQVAPAELENVLRQHPEIADVAVIGVKHESLGEAPRAYVVSKNPGLTELSVSQFLEGKVADFKKLAGGVEFIDAIPKSPSGKILRRVLIQDYQSKHE